MRFAAVKYRGCYSPNLDFTSMQCHGDNYLLVLHIFPRQWQYVQRTSLPYIIEQVYLCSGIIF